MKLDHTIARNILLYVESEITSYSEYTDIQDIMRSGKFENVDEETLLYTCDKLFEAGFLKGFLKFSDNKEAYRCCIESLTFRGHEYLDTIRDDTIFKKATTTAKKCVGELSFNMLGKFCEKILEDLLNKYLS